MDELIFDLQRFAEETIVVSHEGSIATITIGGSAKSIKAGDSNDVKVTLTVEENATTAAAISLESSDNFFWLTDSDGKRKYRLETAGTNDGIVVNIDSVDAMATVGSLEDNESFYVEDSINSSSLNSVNFSKKSYGIISSDKEAILNSSASSVILENTSLATSNDSLVKVVDVTGGDNAKAFTLAGVSDFGSTRHSSVLAMDTSTGGIYAKLYRKDDYTNYYRIIKGDAGSLASVSIASVVASEGIYMNLNDPTIDAGGTKFHVDSSSGSFILYGGTVTNSKQIVSLSSGAKEMTLLDGNLIFTEGQSLKAGNYTLGSYNDSASVNDGIVVYSSSNGISTLGDIDVGETFILTNSTTSDTYTMTNVGLVKKGADSSSDSILTSGSSRLTASDLSFSAITSASAMTDIIDAKTTVVTLSGGTSPSIIAYGTDALATITTVNTNTYSLGTSNGYDDLNLGEWAGVSLGSGKRLALSRQYFISTGNSPLRIMTGAATFAITSTYNDKDVTIVSTANATSQTLSTDVTGINFESGTLVINQYMNSIKLTNANDITIKPNNYFTIISDENGVTLPSGGAFYNIGRGTVTPSTPITIDTDGNAKFYGNFVVGTTSKDTYSKPSNTAYFIYGQSGSVSVTGLNSGESFTVTSPSDSGNVTTTYSVSSNYKLTSSVSGAFKVWVKDGTSNIIETKTYDLKDEYFQEFISASNGEITISNSYVSMNTDTSRLIIDNASGGVNIDTVYGHLTRTSDGYSISSNERNATLNSFVINNVDSIGTVSLDSNFAEATISVSGGHKFQSMQDSEYAISLNSDTSGVHVSGSNFVNLTSGTIFANDSSQIIQAGNHSIKAGTGNITIERNGSNILIGDIITGETFYIDGVEYKRSNYPINFSGGGYNYKVEPARGSLTSESDNDAVAVNISSLTDSNNIRALVADVNGTLTIADTPSIDALVVDNTVSPSYLYAELSRESSKKYYLNTITGATTDQNWNVNTIYLDGGETTINSALTSNVTISTSKNIDFMVNDTSGDFIVNPASSSPTVQNAKDLTLLNGTITAATLLGGANQTIKIGENGLVPMQVKSGTRIIYGGAGTATVNGSNAISAVSVGSNNNHQFAVKSGSMNFLVDDSTNTGKVTITGLNYNSTTNDVFTYNSNYYSLKSAGLVKGNSTSGTQLWNSNGTHTLEGNSVAAADLTDDDNWVDIAPVSNDTASILPANFSGELIFIDSLYSDTYGTLTGSNRAYTLTKGDGDGAEFNKISIGAATAVTLVEFKNDFLNKTIQSAVANFVPTSLSGTDNSYQVTLSNKVAGLSGVAYASLLSGSLNADSNIGVYVSLGANSSPYVKAAGNSNITLTANSTGASVALNSKASFSIEDQGYTYALGKLGLTRTDTLSNTSAITYLNSTQNTFSINEIINNQEWENIIIPENGILTISSAISSNVLIVDSIPPDYQFGKIATTENGFSLTAENSTKAWSNTNTILADSTTVTASSDFKNKPFAGKESGTVFYVSSVTSGDTFTFIDRESGASISNNTRLTQNAGTITTANRNQTITTADNYNVVWINGADGINVAVNDGVASISALETDDSFSLSSGNGSYKSYTMGTQRIIASDNKMLKNTISGAIKASDLLADSNWNNIVTISGGNLTINSSEVASILSSEGSAYVVEGSSDTNIYGTLTRKSNGSYSLSSEGKEGISNLNAITIENTDKGSPITISGDLISVPSLVAGGTTFHVTSLPSGKTSFQVDYAGTYAKVEDANRLTLDLGTIQTSSTTQTISANNKNIYATSLGADNLIFITYDGSKKVSVGGLNEGEVFNIGTRSHTVSGLGVISDNSIGSDSGWDSLNSIFDTSSTFDRQLVTLDADNQLDLSSQNYPAVIVNNLTNPTKKIGELYTLGAGYNFSLSEYETNSISAVNLGGRNITLKTDFDTSIKTATGSYTYVINDDSYRAAGSALTIQSGAGNNKSSLVSGAVLLNSVYSGVKTSNNAISVSGGDITLTAGATDSITGLNSGDVFSIESADALYSVFGAGLFSENKFWNKNDYTTAGVVLDNSDGGLFKDDNWSFYVAVSDSSLAVPPTGFDSTVTSWAIFNPAFSSQLGTLTLAEGKYNISLSSSKAWDDSYILSVNGTTVSLPATGFDRKTINAVQAGATFSITDKNIGYTVTDGANGATVANAQNISLTAGTIALTDSTQTVKATTTDTVYSVSYDSSGYNGISVMVNGSAASIGALDVQNGQDAFYVGSNHYQILSNGSIRRNDGKFWSAGVIADSGTGNGILNLADLMDANNWVGSVSITGGILDLTSSPLGSETSAIVVDKDAANSIYGTLALEENSYSLNSATALATLNAITLGKGKTISLTAEQNAYRNVPIAAGTTTFLATAANTDAFNVSYSDTLTSDATGISLIGGTWQLSDTNQTLTANDKVVQVGATTTVSISNDSSGVNVTGIDSAGEVVTISGTAYSIKAGEISVSLDNSTAYVNGISSGDIFKINDDTFIKRDAGLLKTNSSNYLWIGGDVGSGASLNALTGNDYWQQVATVEGDNVSISATTPSAILINDVEALNKIYGSIKGSGDSFTLTSDERNTLPAAIHLDSVKAQIDYDYLNISVYASGASFVVNSLTADSKNYSVDAKTNSNAAILGNVAQVSLLGGTLGNLTETTNLFVGNDSVIAAGASSTINVGYDNSVITFSGLNDGESFHLGENSYVYKNVGLVKDNSLVGFFKANSTLNHSVTSSALATEIFLPMVASTDNVLSLQAEADVVFVNSASSSLSSVFATQDYDNNLYSFSTIKSGSYTIDAGAIDSGTSISANFKSKVLTPKTGTFYINGVGYTAVDSLTVNTTADNSTLFDGTVLLSAGASVAMTNISSVVAASSGEIHVKANQGTTYTLGELNQDDVFTIGNATFTMMSDNYLVRTISGQNAICTTSVTDKNLASTVINADSNWKPFVQLDDEYALNLDSTTNLSGAIVISNNFADIYASITGSNNAFNLGTIAASASTDSISAINLAGANSTLTANFAATVQTAASNSTYRINGNNYTAKENSQLEIWTSANDSSITSGIISLSNVSSTNPIKTTTGHTISGTVSKVDVANMLFTPGKAETFTVDDQSYTMNELEVGLTWGTDKVWTKSNVESYKLPPQGSDWSNMLVLGSDGELNLTSGAESSNIIIDNGRTKRLASLVAGENEFTLSGINDNGAGISSIKLGDAAETLTLTADFVSTVTTGNGLYKINKVSYNGNGLEITTSKDSSAIYSGTVTLNASGDFNTVSDSTNTYKVTSGNITATATAGTITQLGNLNSGETFTIGNNYYKVLGSNTLVQTESDGTATKIYKDFITSGAINTADIIDTKFVPFVALEDGVLDLSSKLGASGYSAIVLDKDETTSEYTVRIAQLNYTDEGGYQLATTDSGDPTTLNSVKLGSAVKTFTTTIDTTVNTTAKSTYTVNGQTFTAQGELKISATNGNEATLVNGAVTLKDNAQVATAQTDEIIKSTEGSTITVTADETAGTVTISGLNAGETFTFGDTSYTMTPIGLLYESASGNLLNPNVVTDGNSIVATDLDLSGSKWLPLLQATGGALELTTSTLTNSNSVVVVDMTSSTQAVKYGTLAKTTGSVYTLTQDDSDNKLSSIALTKVSATFGQMASNVNITANEKATFSVTATGNFTVNAAGNGNPIISDAGNLTSVDLSAGTIQAPTNIPVTAGGYTITATSGAMTISNTDNVVSIGGLDSEETFTIGNNNYKVMPVGKLFDVTDAAKPSEILSGFANKTFTPDNAEFINVLAVQDGALDISAQTANAYIYDSLTNPTTQYATLTVEESRNKTLNALSNEALVIQTVTIAAKDNLTVDFTTQIKSPVGTVTVNGSDYNGATELLINSDGTTSTLNEGTITLNAITTRATDSSKNILTQNSGTFKATAASGKFTTLTELNNAESFIYNGATYTQNIPGLINTTSKQICPDILAGTTINLADLSGATWNNFAAPVDGVLDISNLTSTTIIYDDATTPTTKYATLTIADGKKTLAGEENNSIVEVVIAAGDDLTVDFATQVDSAAGTVTVNGKTYAGTTELLIDSDGKTSTLYIGTITLNETNTSATDSNGNTLAREVGSFTATASDGAFTTITGLNNTESFTYGGNTYVQSAQGLRSGTTIRPDLTGTTINLADLNGTWINLLAPTNGVLDLSNFSGNANVYNSATNPTTQLATLTTADGKKTLANVSNATNSISAIKIATGDNLAVDFATKTNAPVGSVTVNEKKYLGTTELVITSDGKTSTLTDGTITLAANEAVTTTGGTAITCTAGDGMTVAVNGDNETVTFSGLNLGDEFTINGQSYRVSAVGPMNSSGELFSGDDYTAGITLAAINTASNWKSMLATGATLNLDATTLEDGGEVILVDDASEPTKVYGNLSKADSKYNLVKSSTNNAELTTISASGVAIELAPEYAGVTLAANDSAISNVALTDETATFTLDATSIPSLSNVQSLTLTAGTIAGAVNQAVTAGTNVITPTAITGTLTIGTATISGIDTGDAFTLNDKAYKMLSTGLFNDTDNKLVTGGISDGTLTLADLAETQLIAISSGALDLSGAATGDSLVVDTVESPTKIYGKLNKNFNTYTLTKQADGITSITLPNANATLTTDLATTINAPSSSRTFTVNGKSYTAKTSALTIASDGKTSTLTDGTISLATENATVTTTSGTTITYTTDGDGLTVAVNGGITFSDLTAGDTFKIGENAYRVTQLGFHDDANYLWTGADYTSGVTLDAINNSDNWTRTVAAANDNLTVDDSTLTDGASAIIIDSATAATKTLGTLSRTDNAYALTKGDSEKLSGITVDGTALAIDNQLADVPVTAKGATFTVTAGEPYTVDATGDTVSISDAATAIEISTGTIAASTNQTVTATSDSGETKVIGQANGTFNIGGEAFTVADNSGSVTFGMTNGVPDKVSDLEANANVTIDGRTYTAPQDNSTLTYTTEDGWFFEGYVPTKYNITVDGDGNILVDAGVKFSDVISSGKTLPEDNTIKLSADVNAIAVNVTNNGTAAIAINDKDGNALVENLGTVADVTFDNAGVMVEKTSDVAGAVFNLDNGQSFETETATIKANADDCAVGIGSGGTSVSVDKAATVDAPDDTALTLGNASYTVNGVNFTTSGTAQASITSAGVKIDLVTSDAITYNSSGYDGTGTAKADISKAGGVSLTSGASVNGAAGKTFNIAGTVTLDANTIDAASATDVTAKASGYAVGSDDVTVTGLSDGYKVDISGGKISGLENVGNANGVTIGGLANGTIKTDKAGAFTVADKTFVAIGDASVTYGIENGTLTSADDVDSVISGDFADGLTVNRGKLQVTGQNVSLDASQDDDRKVDGFNDKATLTAADNVIKIEPTGAGEFTFGDHIFKTDDATIAFNLRLSSVTGVDSLENGNLIISQDETNFTVNADIIDLAEIDAPVTLEIADSKIQSVYGLHSGMDGLDNATVYGLSAATVNGVYFEIAGGSVDVIVSDGVPVSLYGLESEMTVNSAPSIAARTTENGTFQFVDAVFNINDTLDGVVVFDTDGNTKVINIGEFEGSISGDLEDLNLNDKPFSSSSDKVTVANDGADILKLGGLSSGDSISGSLSKAIYIMPEGTLNVNDRGYILSGDDNGVSMTGDGMEVVGLDIDASLTVAKGGAYSVNEQNFNAKDGDTFIAGRDGVYIVDPNNKPIGDKTRIDDIIENLIGKQGEGTVSLSGDSAARAIANGNLDSPMALTLDGTQTADFSDSRYSKRVTLLGGDQNIKFNDEGKNSAYVTPTSRGKKNIELGDGGDVAVNDSPYAKVSIKAGAGSDTIVNRGGAKSTVDVKKNGDTTLVPTSGKVTLQNYSNDNNAKIRTFDYKDLGNAIKSNEIKFGNGVMTMGDAVIVFDPNASTVGGTFANLVDYSGDGQRVGFTHKEGGLLNASTSADDLILKGNYAESSSDTQKNGSSTLISGHGDDTILAGGGDYINAGGGENQIYITDKALRDEGATIVLAGTGKNTVHNFTSGHDEGDAIQVNDLSALDFTFGDEGLVMRSGRAQIIFDGLEPAEDLVTYTDGTTGAPYEIKLSDGKATYNAAIAQEDKDIGIGENSDANIFYGNKNGSGLNFSEYAGAVEVNLNSGAGNVNGTAAQFYNINKVAAGAGNSSLIGKAGAKNTLIAGTGNTSIWSNAGRDLMDGNSSEDKDGSTMFYYLAGDGRDTITNFDFMTSANDNSDIINITADNAVTEVYLRGDNVVMQINNSSDDYLTLTDARGKDFKINNLIAKVDVNADFDNVANCYVADANNATMKVGAGVGNAQVWLDDRITGRHGVYYLGEIKYLDASTANGKSTLVGNDLDNVIYGGEGSNSIWGGFGANDDLLIGGKGHNTFFFGMENGHDTITSVKAGDVIDLTTIGLEQIASTTINGGVTKLELTDGSSLEIQGSAAVEYRLNDGNRYTADHNSGQWKSNA